MGESLLQGWSVVKCAVVHSDGGLVPEIIVDTHYLNSYLCSYALVLEIWENSWTCKTSSHKNENVVTYSGFTDPINNGEYN